MEEGFDVIVVGGGPAGLSSALVASRNGLSTVVLERGEESGTKNMFGGVLYTNSLKKLVPEFWKIAPVERPITKRRIDFLTENSLVSIEYENFKYNENYNGFSVYRSKFDKWFSKYVEESGVLIANGVKVDEIVHENGRVVGVRSGDDILYGKMVIIADGAISLIAQKEGMKKKPDSKNFALGMKEIIKLSQEDVEKRFGIKENEGIEILYLGYPTKYMRGGGFLYTYRDSISLGLIVSLEELRKSEYMAIDLIEDFKENRKISELIDGGTVLEYSAHVIPEGGYRIIPELYRDNILVVGDAAGFVINSGLYLNGMDLAVLSGIAAGQTAAMAKKMDDFSSRVLKNYVEILKKSILMDMETYKKAPEFLEDPRIYDFYPKFLNEIMGKIVTSSDDPKKNILTMVKEKDHWEMIGTLLKGVRSL